MYVAEMLQPRKCGRLTQRYFNPLLINFNLDDRMRFHWISPAILALSAALIVGCASPGPRMMRGERHDTVIGGTRFTVYRVADEVEIYRTSAEIFPRLSEVMARATEAVRATTGCTVKSGSLRGDAALMTASLNCG